MTKREEYWERLDKSFLEVEYEFFANHTSNQLYDILEKTIAVKGLCEGASVFIKIYFGRERDFDQFLHQGKFQPSEDGDLFVTFAYGKKAELAERCLANYDKIKTKPGVRAPEGIRVFQLWDQDHELQTNVEWNVEISVIHPHGEDELIAERLEVAFRSFFLPIPYVFVPVSHLG